MPKVSKKQSGKGRTALKRLPPSAPAARDEGPRLLPLDESGKEPSRLEHYLELADSALSIAEKDHRSSKD
ncbi:MAG TPA: hypothetical protein VFI95_22425 [Terriglobales bacterium]|nr:hypothetical protein [Terriglobales bacterium]